MVRKLAQIIRQTIFTLLSMTKHLDQIKVNQGLILTKLNQQLLTANLKDYEYQVFSQWGEDGIIQRLVEIVDVENKTFIEFGVEDFFESNCRFLMTKDNWSGFVMDGSQKNISRLKASSFFWKYHLEAKHAFITRENINELLQLSGFGNDLGILSIDLDGMDYYVLEAISNFNPRILICEFNSVFGGDRKISVPYREDFDRTKAHYSNLYWGASLPAINDLASARGYALVGTNSAGNNAFFVKENLLSYKLPRMSVNEAFSPSNHRESRDKRGNLSFLSSEEALAEIRGLPVFNIETKTTEHL